MTELDYPGALKLLARIQREHPEQRDETQRLIMQIITNQGKEYNQVLARLIHVLYQEQDADKALPLINTLSKLDPSRSGEQMRQSIVYVKFLKLMDAAAAMLSQGKIAEAIDLYLLPITNPEKAGFDMDKQKFDSGGYGDIITASVREAVGKIVDAAGQARGEVASSQAAQAALVSLVTSPVSAQSPDQLDQAFSPLAVARGQQKTVAAAVSSLDSAGKAIGPGAAGTNGQSYLRYLASLCQGRKDKPPEGIEQAISMLWEPQAEAAAEAAAKAAASTFADAEKRLAQGDLAAAEPKLQDAY